jgi:hypothetical protein
MNTQQLADALKVSFDKLVDREASRRVQSSVARAEAENAAARKAQAEIVAAARTVALLTEKVLQATLAGRAENALRKKLFEANRRLVTVMRNQGRMQ